MKNILTLLFSLFALFSSAQKELDPKWLDIPEHLTKNACAIVRDYQVEYLLKSPTVLEVKTYKVITILNNEGKSYANQIWHYDLFSKYIFGEILIFNKNGERLEKENMKDMEDIGTSGMSSFYDDSRLMVYKPEVKETPYTLIISNTIKHSGFFQMPTWFPQNSSDIAIENASLTILNPNNIAYKIKQINLEDDQFSFIDEGLNKRWDAKNLKAFIPEGYVKASQLPIISFPMKEFEVGNYSGSNETWQSFGKWSSDLIKGRDVLPEETKIKIREMVKDVDDAKEKAKIIYTWMQENTRYISIQYGIGGWQPYPASEVDELKYGDCKGLVNYTKALFAAAGIDSYYSLVYGGAGKKELDTRFPSNQFNHVILCVPFSGDTTWVECTSDNIALGYLGSFTDDRYALLVNGAHSKLVKTPHYSKTDNTQIRAAHLQVNPGGSIHAKINTSYAGVQFENRRAQVNEDEKERKDNLYESLDIAGFTIKNISYDYNKAVMPIIVEVLEIEVPKYASATNNRMFVPLNLMNKNTYKPDKDTARKNKIFQSMNYIDVDSLVYTLPAGYEIERIPKSKSIESIYGKFSFSATIDGDQVIYVRKMEQNAGEFPKDGWNDFRKYKLAIVKADKATVILKKTVN